MRRGETKGYYTNFDVSNQEQRKSWYFFAIALLAATIVILFATNQPHAIRFGFLLSALPLLCSQILNYMVYPMAITNSWLEPLIGNNSLLKAASD